MTVLEIFKLISRDLETYLQDQKEVRYAWLIEGIP